MSGKGLLAGILGGGAQGYADVTKMEIGRQIEDERAAAADRRQRALMELQQQYARENAETSFGYNMAAQEAGHNYQSERDKAAAESASRAKAADREFEWDKMLVDKAYDANAAAQKHQYQMDEDANKERAKAKYDKTDALKMGKHMQDVLKDGRSALQLAFNVKIGTDEFGNITDVQGDERSRSSLFAALEMYDRSARNDPTFSQTASTELLNNAIEMARQGYVAPSRWKMGQDGTVVLGASPDGTPITADANNPVVAGYLQSIGISSPGKRESAATEPAAKAPQQQQKPAAAPKAAAPAVSPQQSADAQFLDRLRNYAAKSQEAAGPPKPQTSATQAPIVGAEANRLAGAYSRVNDLIDKISYGRANYGLLDSLSEQDIQDAARFAQITGRTGEVNRINQLLQVKGAK